MELKTIEKELLIKAAKKNVKNILTHGGFVNNCNLSDGDRKLLRNLSAEIKENDIAIIIEDKVFTPYIAGYNGGDALAGIKISKAIYLPT
jgi:hypothetical protein